MMFEITNGLITDCRCRITSMPQVGITARAENVEAFEK